jgi:hypothetical protein
MYKTFFFYKKFKTNVWHGKMRICPKYRHFIMNYAIKNEVHEIAPSLFHKLRRAGTHVPSVLFSISNSAESR